MTHKPGRVGTLAIILVSCFLAWILTQNTFFALAVILLWCIIVYLENISP